ncbi:MAG: sigma-70 family RNA polymerase sigma factor [Cyanobacteria bacterium P01_F01_bin.150]
MRNRQELVELFSTFIQLEADRFGRWLSDPRLQKSMSNRLSAIKKASDSEHVWGLYWLQLFNEKKLERAKEHLFAYLQEPCFYAAQKISSHVRNTQYGFSDYFQLGIAEAPEILKSFQMDKGARLKGFAQLAFFTRIRDHLRRHQQADLCTDWALLRKLTRKRVKDVLETAGESPQTIDEYQLAWSCFQALYVTAQVGNKKLPEPDQKQWEAIAHLYNTERLNQLDPSSTVATPDTIRQWMKTCAEEARRYLYPPIMSLNTSRPNQESGEWLDNLVGTEDESLLSEIVAQEEMDEWRSRTSQLMGQLTSLLEQLAESEQTLLDLCYRQNLKQKDMAQQLDIPQYKVSRQLSRVRKKLLKELVIWAEEALHIAVESNLVKDMDSVLEDWLRFHYGAIDSAD